MMWYCKEQQAHLHQFSEMCILRKITGLNYPFNLYDYDIMTEMQQL